MCFGMSLLRGILKFVGLTGASGFGTRGHFAQLAVQDEGYQWRTGTWFEGWGWPGS